MKLYEYLKKIFLEEDTIVGKEKTINNLDKIKEKFSKIKKIKFIFPNYATEFPEIERIKKELHLSDEEIKKIENNFKKPKLIFFKHKELDNSDYFSVKNIDDVLDLSKKYNKDINSLLTQFENGEIEAPVILIRNEKTPYLVGGNTRLMLLKILNIKPKVLEIKL